MNKIKLIFIGTGEIGTGLLKALHQHSQFEIPLVVTGLDKPAGRKMELQPSEIKKMALELGIEVFQPENIKSPEAIEKLKSFAPDIMLVIAYGQILNQEVLDIPRIDCLNVHASLLPKYRGASPIQSVLLNREKETGLTLMKMVRQMDAGPIYEKFSIHLIFESETSGTLEERLATLAAEKIPQAIVEVVEGKLKPIPQDDSKATYVTKISKADGQINWNEAAELIEAKIRAFHPWPSTYTFFKGKRLKILGAHTQKNQRLETQAMSEEDGWTGKGAAPKLRQFKTYESSIQTPTPSKPAGTVVEENGLVGIITGKGILLLNEVQLEGKKPQAMKEFLNGNTDFIEAQL